MAVPEKESRTVVLVVDDDPDIRLALEMLLGYEGYSVWTAKDGEEALARVEAEAVKGRRPGVVMTDLKMPRMDGLELLDRLRARSDPPPVVLISGHGDIQTAVEAIRRGALNFLEKPLSEERVRVTIRGALRETRLAAENQHLRRQLGERWELVGASAPLERLRAQIEQVAASEASVLITGENGTGKEVVARAPRSPRN
jgi:DNA-binding NtrC family response regulator